MATSGRQRVRQIEYVLRLINYNRKKTLVYHTVNGDHALFHTSKTAKIIKVILLRAPRQNVNVLLSNISFIIFAVFDCETKHDRR